MNIFGLRLPCFGNGAETATSSQPAMIEDELCDFGPDGLSSGRSPDRLDALVWALTALMLGEGGEPPIARV